MFGHLVNVNVKMVAMVIFILVVIVVMVVMMLGAISRCTLTAPGGDDGGARSLSTPSTSRRAHPLLPPLCTLLQFNTSHFSLWFLQNSIANIFIILLDLLSYFSGLACTKKKTGDPNLKRDTPGYPVLWRFWSEPNPLSLIQSRLFEPAYPLGWFFHQFKPKAPLRARCLGISWGSFAWRDFLQPCPATIQSRWGWVSLLEPVQYWWGWGSVWARTRLLQHVGPSSQTQPW